MHSRLSGRKRHQGRRRIRKDQPRMGRLVAASRWRKMPSQRRDQLPAVARSQLPQLLSQPISQRRNLRRRLKSLPWSWITSGSGPSVAGRPTSKQEEPAEPAGEA